MAPADTASYQTTISRHRRVCFAAVVTALVALGCSSVSPTAVSPSGQTVTDGANQIEVRAVAFASVLVTDAPKSLVAPLDRIRISPTSIVVDPGETIQLTATAFSRDGGQLSDIEFVWTAPDSRAGTMAEDGRFQAGATPGVFDNSISVIGIQNTPAGIQYTSTQTAVTVVGEAMAPALARLEIIPDRPTVLLHQIYRMRAVGLDADGIVIPGVSFAWRLNNPGLGRLNEIGLLTVDGDEGRYEGAISVTGVWRDIEATAVTDIQVVSAPKEDDYLNVHALPQRFFLDPGQRIQLRAVTLNGLGRIAAGTELRWDMVDARAGSIDGNGHFVAGDTPGVYAEAVRVEAVVPGERGFVRAEDFASVVIRQRKVSPLQAISVQPGTVISVPGGRATLVVRTADASGEPANDIGITWEVLREGVGGITEVGGFTAGIIPGIYKDALRVTAEQRLEDETITRVTSVDVVITGTLTRSEVRPPMAVVTPLKIVHFALTAWDDNDVALPGLVVLWSVTDERAGTIDALGNFRAGRVPGMYEDAIRAEIIQRYPDVR